jgi:hypothetical protein
VKISEAAQKFQRGQTKKQGFYHHITKTSVTRPSRTWVTML